VELPGTDSVPYFEDPQRILDEIEQFITGTRKEPEPDRVLSTVLFSDIVGSTERAAGSGDARWRELLDMHDTIVREQITAHGGRYVKNTGDGFLASFDGPARAIRCAGAIRDLVRRLGLEVRQGVHTGEIELRGADIGGITVHIGARVSTLAKPGEVVVSRTVADLVAGSMIEFADRGVHVLKGVPGTWQIYAAGV
jgi:class 3 adenylate cyclase